MAKHPQFFASQHDELLNAVGAKNADVLKKLLQDGFDPNSTGTGDTETLLIRAIQIGFIEGALLLIEHGAAVTPRSARHLVPLAAAAGTTSISDIEAIRLCQALLDAGADPDGCTGDARTALYEAAVLARPQLCNLLIESGASADAASVYGWTPLRAIAGNAGHIDTMRVLVRAGADSSHSPVPQVGDGHPLLSPFQWAVSASEPASVRFFLDECHEDPDQKTRAGETMYDLCRSPFPASKKIQEMLFIASAERAVATGIAGSTQDLQPAPSRSHGLGVL
jgi:ankyrin repeat protein